ncbi:dTDP-4-dehydrorhamnose reductase [Arcicella aurantiaca]|uniref:dTDP-4-dehydrorhamnose reductase n=1 Tax=Arcicella aurantiaca TaxID=591202 RepID=A0A316EBQ6_9BACT|nr:dTDP-4-dehydrorhamnose reductase [Arcicella aurantiaca]PWK27114.1 dTDP-4-dehydrorhamnose reductase [Arcicella aurantiaca]
MNILVLGGTGQLGQCLGKVASQRNITSITFADEIVGNILDIDVLEKLFIAEKPAFVINCAAYTAVDKAEDEVELSRKINRDGAENIAKLCVKYKATLLHISTDFIFEGNVPTLLNEESPAEPISVYGLTKLEGEKAITDVLDQYYIVRTAWLYSEFANNFMKTMIKLGTDRDSLGIIADQVGTPTYGVDLAGALLDIIASDKKAYGIYHYSNEGAVSWYDFAKAIFEIGNITVAVKPLKTSEYPTKATRPAFSVMDKTKIKTTFGIDVPYWRDSLKVAISAL